jgi:peptide/nickel transport system ATP-binding protein
MTEAPLLQIKNLAISFNGNEVIHNISYHLNANEILGIVGESGSGKSVSSLAILGLLPKKISAVSGTIHFKDIDLTQINQNQFQHIRGNKIAMILQDPSSSLIPAIRCGTHAEEF